MSAQSLIYAFAGHNLVAQGPVSSVAARLKSALNHGDKELTLLFDGSSGQQFDLDLSGSAEEVEKRYGKPAVQSGETEQDSSPKRRGRPKLGVVGREVTLLPRHWEWLDTQRGGASAALRRLIETTRRENAGEDRIKSAQDAAQRFMYAMAGNLPGFEEAIRALYARELTRFEQETAGWPADIRSCAREYAKPALS